MRPRMLRALVLPAMAVLASVSVLVPISSAQAATFPPLNGFGSSWAGPAISQWSRDLQPNGINITYTANGSAAGRSYFTSNQADFAGSDIAFLTSSNPDPFAGIEGTPSTAYSYIPIVAGGTSFLYNLVVGGHKITNLRLSGATIAKIFTGQITNWADPAITHDYGAPLPSQPITVVTRSDGSGASYMFSRWMWKVYPSLWTPFCRAQGGKGSCGPTEFYPGGRPNFKAQNGSNQAASYVASYEGSIGYDEYSYALLNQIPVVKVLNSANYYTLPTPPAVAIALTQATFDTNPSSPTFLMQNLDNVYTYGDPRAYPLSSYSYLIVPRDSRPGTSGPPPIFTGVPGKGRTLSTWLNYVLCDAQQTAGTLGYSPLPKNLVVGGFAQENHIPGHVATPDASHLNGCNNPTYHNGIDFLLQAPQPSPCNYVTAPLYNCVVKNGKATQGPGGSGPGGTGPGGTGPGGTGPGGTSPGGTSPGGASGPGGTHINPNTGQVVGGTTATSGSPVYAQPVSLVGKPPEEWMLGTLTALELLGAVAVPTLLGTWLQRRRRRA
jgi:ABC-type phosphate transport system substrate-binding protein